MLSHPISQNPPALQALARKKRAFGKFTDTAAYAEQSIFRRIAACGKGIALTKSQRRVLVKCVNLHFYHRGKRGFFDPGNAALAKALGLTKRTVDDAVRRLTGLGILRQMRTGNGRGNRAKLSLDLLQLHRKLWPTFAVRVAGAWRLLSDLLKVEKTPSPLYKNNNTRSRWALRLSPALDFGFLDTLGRRLRACQRFIGAAPPHKSNLGQALSEFVCMETGEVFITQVAA